MNKQQGVRVEHKWKALVMIKEKTMTYSYSVNYQCYSLSAIDLCITVHYIPHEFF